VVGERCLAVDRLVAHRTAARTAIGPADVFTITVAMIAISAISAIAIVKPDSAAATAGIVLIIAIVGIGEHLRHDSGIVQPVVGSTERAISEPTATTTTTTASASAASVAGGVAAAVACALIIVVVALTGALLLNAQCRSS
jgi:hypothetical protein